VTKKQGFFLCLFSFYIILILSPDDNMEDFTVIQVTGVVRLVGSGPLPELVITGSEFQWFITRDDRDKLHDLQHQTVTVEGEETIIELRFANNQFAGYRRNLRNIRIISTEGLLPLVLCDEVGK
jgi:hypothetical protein